MSAEDIKQERERERQFKADQRERERALDEAFNSRGELSRGWMEEVLDTRDLEEKLQPATIKKIQALLNKQWILSNLTEAETHDRMYKLEAMKLKILDQHPPEDTVIAGPLRAALYDDPEEDLRPLTQQERITIDQLITTMKNMVARSRGGFERKQINTSIARSETESSDVSEESGMFDGLLSN